MKHSFNMKQILTISFLFVVFAVQSQDENHLNLDGGLALDGYDPVAYFTEGKAIPGNKQFRVQSGHAVYYFSSAKNKELFSQNPEKFKPEYGGWCAYAMGAKGEKVPIDPETFKIVNGKLYLFYNRFFNNTLIKWNEDEKNLLPKADANWIKIIRDKQAKK